MEKEHYIIHLNLGHKYGKEATCGSKINYKTEESATEAANAMNLKPETQKELEPYPCYWCNGWHIGRKLTSEELKEFGNI